MTQSWAALFVFSPMTGSAAQKNACGAAQALIARRLSGSSSGH
jgi:phosphopantothenoylcysteine synthetase/decarboxylase